MICISSPAGAHAPETTRENPQGGRSCSFGCLRYFPLNQIITQITTPTINIENKMSFQL